MSLRLTVLSGVRDSKRRKFFFYYYKFSSFFFPFFGYLVV